MTSEFLLSALVGSHNYNLNTKSSDKDWKQFVLPGLLELFTLKYAGKTRVENGDDIAEHDIRKIVEMFYKSNINFTQILYSVEVHMTGRKSVRKYIEQLYSIRNQVSIINLPYLYKTGRGMMKERFLYLHTGTEPTKHLVEQFGYDTKQAMQGFRAVDFPVRFHRTDFTDFKAALWYDEKERVEMLAIKNGELTEREFMLLFEDKKKEYEKVEADFNKHKPNEELKKELELLVYKMVQAYIMETVHEHELMFE